MQNIGQASLLGDGEEPRYMWSALELNRSFKDCKSEFIGAMDISDADVTMVGGAEAPAQAGAGEEDDHEM